MNEPEQQATGIPRNGGMTSTPSQRFEMMVEHDGTWHNVKTVEFHPSAPEAEEKTTPAPAGFNFEMQFTDESGERVRALIDKVLRKKYAIAEHEAAVAKYLEHPSQSNLAAVLAAASRVAAIQLERLGQALGEAIPDEPRPKLPKPRPLEQTNRPPRDPRITTQQKRRRR